MDARSSSATQAALEQAKKEYGAGNYRRMLRLCPETQGEAVAATGV
jgi:hypothetical protein